MALMLGRQQINSLEVLPASICKHYEERGSEIFQHTVIVDGKQHYAKQILEWDDVQNAWSASWVGDYILVNGEFQEFEEGDMA